MRRITKIILACVLLGGFCCSAPRLASAEPWSPVAPPLAGKPPAKPGCGAFAADPLPPDAMTSAVRVPFVSNDGQVADRRVKYYARTFGGTVYALSNGRIVYSLPKFDGRAKTGPQSRSGSVVLQEYLQGGFAAEPLGVEKSRVAVNSFIGNRPENWRVNLPAFDRLDFGEVYEGISLLLLAHGNNVEKIFVLSPGADPREIIFSFEGASGIEIMPDGKLELQTALGAVYFTRPVAWQIEDTGIERSVYGDFKDAISERFVIPAKAGIQARDLLDSRLHGNDREYGALHADKNNLSVPLSQGRMTPVEVSYALDEDGTVRFELSSYDPNKILVIDPLLASTFIGGGGADAVQAMVVDSQTNVYVAGYTDSSDFPTNSPYQPALAGGQDAFVSKFDANLGSLSASTYLGGSSNDQATAIGIDASSRIWLAGYTESTNFPTSSPMDSTYNGNGDAFVAVLSADLGTPFLATYLGGSNVDCAAAIAMDNSSRQQYVAGYTESANFPVTNLSGYATNYNGARDAFAAVFSNNVSSLKAGTFLGGTNADEAAGVVVSPGTGLTNFVYVVGSTSSTNFPVTNGYQMANGGYYDVFVSKLSARLTNLSASTFLGGIWDDKAYTVALDASNKLYVAGWTRSPNFPTTNNPYSSVLAGEQDIFASSLTNNLSNLGASTYIGGAGDDVARCLVIDSSSITNLEYVYLAGSTASSDFPTTPNAYDRSYNGGGDAFTLRLDGRLTNLYASTYLGGAGSDQALALALAPDSNTFFVAGITASSDFPASDAAYGTVFCGGTSDGFVTRFAASLAYGTLKWKKEINNLNGCSSPALTWDGTVAIGVSTALIGFARSGAENWRVVTHSAIAYLPYDHEGLGVPAVDTNDIIYINTTGKVYAITAGTVNWTYPCAIDSSFSSIGLGNEGKIYFGQGSKFYALRQNGTGLWSNSVRSGCNSSPAISSNGTIYAVGTVNPASFFAFDSAGSTSHEWTTVGNMYSSPALGTNGAIYAANGTKLYAFSPDGTTTRTWTAAGDMFSSPAIGSNGVVYVGGGNSLYAFNPGGTTAKIWRAGGEVKSSPAVAADGSILVGATNGFYSFNPDGTTNWFFNPDDELYFQTPLIDSEGTIYFSDNTSIYAIYGSQPPADSAWPMFRHDALRTGNQGMDAASFLRPANPTVSKYGTFTDYIRVGWNANSNALNYELWRNTNDSITAASRIRRLTQTNYNDSSIDPGKIYYYWLKVKTPVALSVFSAFDFGGVPPYPPEGVTATKGDPTNYVQVNWQVSTNATTYYVYRSLSDDTNTAVRLDPTTSSTNYADYTVEPSFRYYYWVTAGNAEAGVSGFSSNDYGGIPCWPPAGFSASQGSYFDKITLGWNSSTGASFYVVYRNTENNSDTAAIINETGGLAMDDTDVTPMRRYYYWLKTTNEFGLSGFSSLAYGWRLLTAPLAVYASAGAYSNMIRVSWVAGSTDAVAHVIFRSESSDSSTAAWLSEVVYNDQTATNYDDTAITRGISYYYWVAAKNNYGTSSLTAASAPGGTPPATPTDLNATDGIYSNMVKVTWNSSAGATYYSVYRHESFDSSSATLVGSTLTNYYEDRSAVMGVLYYYWVKAGNNYGISGLSTFNSGWRAMLPPDNITAGDGISTSEVSVSWSPAPNATAYELWRGTSSNIASASRLVNNVTAVSYSDQSANPGTVYYYRVKAKRGNYVSAFSGYDYGYKAIGLLDIGVSDFVFVPTALGLLTHPSAVSFKVSNLSAIDMIEPNNTVQYDFYLTRNANFGDGDKYWFGGTNTSLSLNAGTSSKVVMSQSARSVISIPAWASGSYYVFVFINHCLPSGWSDPNLANNVTRRYGDPILVSSVTALQPVWNDYDGDGKSDLAVYQEASGTWRFWLSTSDYAPSGLPGLGETGYRAVPRDYDGDGKFDPAVYQQAGGTWRVCLSASDYQAAAAAGLGGAGQYAVPADYDGDGRVDPAVYQETHGTWRAWLSDSGYAEVNVSGMGGASWRPVPADYDGDGHTDPAVYQETTGTWQIWLSASGYQPVVAVGWGGSGQRAVPADYDGDGRVDLAVYQETIGGWRVWASSDSYREARVSGWGGSGQTAVPGDYDGDGRVDAVVYWESMGIWRFWLSGYGYSEMDILLSGGEGFHAITAEE